VERTSVQVRGARCLDSWIGLLLEQLIGHLPTVLAAALFVGGIVLLTVGAIVAARRVLPARLQLVESDVAGTIATVVSAIFAVLLAFVVVVVWQQWDDAQSKVQQEANALANLYEEAGVFPEPRRSELRAQLRDYVRVVLSDEWPALVDGRDSPHARDALIRLRQTYRELQFSTTQDSLIYADSVQQINAVSDLRRLRILASRDSIPLILWAVLIVGAVLTLVLSYYFSAGTTTAQATLTTAVAVLIAVSIFLLLAMDNPYSGQVAVSSDALTELLSEWGEP
jgi:hypothetical protein